MLRPKGLSIAAIGRLLLQGMFPPGTAVRHVFLAIADHYEPMWGGASPALQRERVAAWVKNYPRMAHGITDSRGRPPQHTFFYPAEDHTDLDDQHIDQLAGLCRRGYGDVEIHLHHDNDNAENLSETLGSFKETLHHRHGLLETDEHGDITFGFVHGNWALDNSRPDGRWCGVNNELTVLREMGCYADFTMPSAPSPTQTRTVNSIYYAIDDPTRPKSHDRGIPAQVGVAPPENGLLMIQGPLMLDWTRRKLGVLPGLENGDLQGHFPPTRSRFDLWRKANVGVIGRPDWVFIKLHTHGAKEDHATALLGEPMRRFHEALAELAKRETNFRYDYVTAREMAAVVHQAEQGCATPRIAQQVPADQSAAHSSLSDYE
jgi:hypothetical protein